MVKKTEIPELLCLGACFLFIGLTIPTVLVWKPTDVGIITMPLYFGLFMFLLCICCILVRKQDELKDRVVKLEQTTNSEPGSS